MTENDDDVFEFKLDRKDGVPQKESMYTKEFALEEIKRFADAHPGKRLTGTAYDKWSARRGNRHSLAGVFGTWTKLLLKAGIFNSQSRFSNKVITDDDCIEYYELVWRWRGRQPSALVLRTYALDNPNVLSVSPDTIGRRWGSLKRFAMLFVDYKNKKISKAEFFNKKVKNQKRVAISKRLRAEVLKRDKKTCQDCGKTVADKVKLEVHHIIPVSQNGPTTIENLITNCESCNKGKSDKVLD